MQQTVILCAVALFFTLLWLLLVLRAGKKPADTGETGLMQAAFRAGYLLAGFSLLQKMQSPSVPATLRALYPTGDLKELCKRYYAKKLGKLSLLFLAGLHLAWMMSLGAQNDSALQNGNALLRGGYEKDEEKISLVITGEDGQSRVFDHSLLGRTYPQQELLSMADRLEEELPSLVLGENEDDGQIRTPLLLQKSYEGYPFLLDWESSDYTLVDSDGSVYNDTLSSPAEITLTATLSYRSFEREISFPVTVLPALLSEEELRMRSAGRTLDLEDAKQQENAVFLLPDSLWGQQVTYAIKGEGSGWLVLPAVMVLVICLYFLQDHDLTKELDRKKKRVESEYPRFVGKFVLLYGAGMSVRRILERLSEDRGLPELSGQLSILLRDLHNGILEQTALQQFGHRLASPLYIKFSGLLIGNLKKGNTELLRMLAEEADEAFLVRRNQAKKKGEEAGTKLLFPMILMLGVVMAVIMLPAFLSF